MATFFDPLSGQLINSPDQIQTIIDIQETLALEDLTDVDATVPEDGQTLSWDQGTTSWKPTTNALAQEVDTTTITPTVGKKLGYTDNAKWEPVDSSIQEASDYKPNPIQAPYYNTAGSTPLGDGEYQRDSSTSVRVAPTSFDGTDYTTELSTHSGTIWYLIDDTTLYSSTYLGWSSNFGGYGRIDTTAYGDPNNLTTIQVFFSDPGTPPYVEALVDGQTLLWNDTESAFMPTFVTRRVTDSGTAASGALTLTSLGEAGILRKVSTDLAAWIVIYGSAAARTADAGRAYNTDPTPGDGVLAEFYIGAGSSVSVSPAATWYNDDTVATSALYLAVRDQAGAAVNATVTVETYKLA